MWVKSLIISCALLAGCCAPVPKPPTFDSYLTSECVDLVLERSFGSWEEVLIEKSKNKRAFEECKKKHHGLLRSLDKYMEEFNATK